MSNYADIPELPGYVSVEEAANRLGISKTRVYGYINDGRFSAVKASHTIMIPIQEIENYRRNITGRPRKNTPVWRIPPRDNDLQITSITVQVYPDKVHLLRDRLAEIKQSGKFLFPGTIARYVSQNENQTFVIEIDFVWRGASMPNEEERERELEAFRERLADILDWSTAHYRNRRILMHT